MTAEQILSRFPFKEGVYRLFSPAGAEAALQLGWVAVSRHESGRVLMWLDRERLKG